LSLDYKRRRKPKGYKQLATKRTYSVKQIAKNKKKRGAIKWVAKREKSGFLIVKSLVSRLGLEPKTG
jgi:hypothetical protein